MPPNTRSTHRPSASAIAWPLRYQGSRKKKPNRSKHTENIAFRHSHSPSQSTPTPRPNTRLWNEQASASCHSSPSGSTIHVMDPDRDRDIPMPSVERMPTPNVHVHAQPPSDHLLKRPASIFLKGLGAEGRRVTNTTVSSTAAAHLQDDQISAIVSRRVTPRPASKDWRVRLESARLGSLRLDVRRHGDDVYRRGEEVGDEVDENELRQSFGGRRCGVSFSRLPPPHVATPPTSPPSPSPPLSLPADQTPQIISQIQTILQTELAKWKTDQQASHLQGNNDTTKQDFKQMMLVEFARHREMLSQDRFREFVHARKVLGRDRVRNLQRLEEKLIHELEDTRRDVQGLGKRQEIQTQALGRNWEAGIQSLSQHHDASMQSLGRWMQDGVKTAMHCAVADIRAKVAEDSAVALNDIVKQMDGNCAAKEGVVLPETWEKVMQESVEKLLSSQGDHEGLVNSSFLAECTTAIESKVGEVVAAQLAHAMDPERLDGWPKTTQAVMQQVVRDQLQAQFAEQFATSGLSNTAITDAVHQITSEASNAVISMSADYRKKLDADKKTAQEEMSRIQTLLADIASKEAIFAEKEAQAQSDAANLVAAREHSERLKRSYDELLHRSTTTYMDLEQARQERDAAQQCIVVLETKQHKTQVELQRREGQIVMLETEVSDVQAHKQIVEEDAASMRSRLEEMRRRYRDMQMARALVVRQVEMCGGIEEASRVDGDGFDDEEEEDEEDVAMEDGNGNEAMDDVASRGRVGPDMGESDMMVE